AAWLAGIPLQQVRTGGRTISEGPGTGSDERRGRAAACKHPEDFRQTAGSAEPFRALTGAPSEGSRSGLWPGGNVSGAWEAGGAADHRCVAGGGAAQSLCHALACRGGMEGQARGRGRDLGKEKPRQEMLGQRSQQTLDPVPWAEGRQGGTEGSAGAPG